MRRALAAAGLGLCLCLAAGAFAAAPLYVPGVALLALASAAAAWVALAARGARVVRELGCPCVQEEAPLRLSVCVARGRVPMPGAEVRAWPDGGVLSPPGSNGAVIIAQVRFSRRGIHALGPASLLVSDPLGLARRTIVSAADRVLVLPRIEPLQLTELGGESTGFGQRSTPVLSAGATEVDSLAPHRPGAPASRIHWPTVARTTTLMERRLVADADQAPVVVVDPRDPSAPEALDLALRAAASLCVHLARHGGCALLLPGDRRPARIDRELYGFPELHARLALLEPDAGAPALTCLATAITVLWVTAADVRARALIQLRAPARCLVSPHPRPGWPVRFKVAGCSGQWVEARGRRAA
ncbi:MAG: DUF58 domain-containing protein [Solirubrobacterales bacterium]|nr:DUF58 domain-containing protein [Solirubrobacterales bacterium]MBV9685003.1 DUF58 domain-containing protein [Solirubrobacterales bacterium]MBV9807592.1 DUF58 domain-containing protein [Solirubrobacterales bacterium]